MYRVGRKQESAIDSLDGGSKQLAETMMQDTMIQREDRFEEFERVAGHHPDDDWEARPRAILTKFQ